MKRIVRFVSVPVVAGGLLLALALSGLISGAPAVQAQDPIESVEPQEVMAGEPLSPTIMSGGMPGRPLPPKPIPYHEPGRASNAESYTTEVMQTNEQGVQEPADISGVDAMVADGLDPLAGNYRMVDMDQPMLSYFEDGKLKGSYYYTSTLEAKGTFTYTGDFRSDDIATGDLNGDGQDERVIAWMDANGHVWLHISEMENSIGRTDSAPAAVVQGDGLDLVVRGYDGAMWYSRDDAAEPVPWNYWAGGNMLSAPAAVISGTKGLAIFGIGWDNQVWSTSYSAGNWSWRQVAGDAAIWQPFPNWNWNGPVPEYPAPAVVAHGNGRIDMFRLASDNTLWRTWSVDNAVNWAPWVNTGQSSSHGVAAVSTGANSLRVFAPLATGQVSTRTCSGPSCAAPDKLSPLLPDGVTIDSAPAAVDTATGFRVYVRGSDGKPYSIGFKNGQWSSWTAGSGEIASAPAAVWRSDHVEIYAQKKDGTLQKSIDGGSSWTDYGGLPQWGSYLDTGLVGQRKLTDPYKDYSIDVSTGNFLGNGWSQIAVAFRSGGDPNRTTLAVYGTGWGFWPQALGDPITLDHDISYFSMTTGDLLGDGGIDEIAVGYVNERLEGTTGTAWGVDIVRVVSGAPGRVSLEKVVQQGGEESSVRCWGAVSQGYPAFAGTLELASGDLDGESRDELTMVVGLGCFYDGIFCDQASYQFKNRIYDLPSGQPSQVKRYNLDEDWSTRDGHTHNIPVLKRHIWSVGLTLAVGDVDGDGRDEVARTWPKATSPTGFDSQFEFGCVEIDQPRNDMFYRDLQVWRLPRGPWPAQDGVKLGSTTQITVTEDATPWWSWSSYNDRLAAGDVDRDLVDEIVLHSGLNDNGQLRLYDYDPANRNLKSPGPLSSPLANYGNLVMGAFTGESLRVGQPTYRYQSRVDSLVAVVNMPPKHRDVVKDPGTGKDVVFEVGNEACKTTSGDPGCSNAKHAKDFTSTSETETKLQRDWTFGQGLNLKLGAGFAYS